MKKVVVFFADGTEEVEAITPVDILRRAGANVTLAGVGKKECVGSHDVKILTDKTVSECTTEDFDMVVLPGGMPGTLNLEKDKNVQEIVKKAYDEGKFIAAICAAPSVLGKMGLLAGKRATCYPGFEKYLEGAAITDEMVVRDGSVITSCGAGPAMDFALMLVSCIYGEEKSEEIRKAVFA